MVYDTGPEFVVTRRDSLGTAAKEHTEQMLRKSAESTGGPGVS